MDDADGGDDIHQASLDVDSVSVYEKRNGIDVDDENDDGDGNERSTYRKPPCRADVFLILSMKIVINRLQTKLKEREKSIFFFD